MTVIPLVHGNDPTRKWSTLCGLDPQDDTLPNGTLVTIVPDEVTCIHCKARVPEMRAALVEAGSIFTEILPPDLEAAIERGVADQSIFTPANRDPDPTPMEADAIHAGQGQFVIPGVEGVCSPCARGDHPRCETDQCACRQNVIAQAKAATEEMEARTVLFAETVRALEPFDGVTYPELLRHNIEQQVDLLLSRVAEKGYTPVGGMYLRIDIEQMAEPKT